jgi:hypothetical protein
MRLRFLRRTPPSSIHLDEATLVGLATGAAAADVEEAAAHLATCAPCTTRFTALDPLATLFDDVQPPATRAPAAVFRLVERPAVRRRWTLPAASLALAAASAAVLLAAHVTPPGAPVSSPHADRISALAGAVLTASHSGDPVELRRALAALDDAVRRLASSEADRAAIVAALQNARAALLGLPADEAAAALADVDAALPREGAVKPTDPPCGSEVLGPCAGPAETSGPSGVTPVGADETPTPSATPGPSPEPAEPSGASSVSSPAPAPSPSVQPDPTPASSTTENSASPSPAPAVGEGSP